MMKDETMPTGPWAFDHEVTAAFGDMLARSIPQHDAMRAAVTELALRYFLDGTDVVDLGASRGDALAPLVSKLSSRARSLVGVEVSKPMLDALHSRFAGEEYGNLRVLDLDLRDGYPDVFASVTLCVLTLQFTPIEHRLRIVRDAWKRTAPGGVFILVEKVLGASADLDAAFVGTYYDLKRRNGYSQEQIERKRLSLEGVLVPVTADWNEDILRRAGFAEVDCFWRWMNFAGWLAVK